MGADEGRASGRPASVRAGVARLIATNDSPGRSSGRDQPDRVAGVVTLGRGVGARSREKTSQDPPKNPPRDPPVPFRVSPMTANRGGKRWVILCPAPTRTGRQMATSPPGRTAVQRWVARDPCFEGRALGPRRAGHVPRALRGGGRYPVSHRWREGCRHVGSAHVAGTVRQTGGGSEGRPTLAWSSTRCTRASRSRRLVWRTTTPLLVNQRRAE